ncbi:hypothetical protein ACWGJ2_27315 [Streptomyces sp. NPDC054796]
MLLPRLRRLPRRISGRLRALPRRARLTLTAGTVALAVLVVGGAVVLVPVLSGDADAASACRQAPDPARRLAADPRRATAALDPGEDMRRTEPLRRLLRTGGAPLCEGAKGTEAAGRALVAAATGATDNARDAGDARDARDAQPHTAAQARIVHGAVLLLGEDPYDEADFPLALAPYVARVLAAYIGDVRRDIDYPAERDWSRPTATRDEARYEDGSGNWSEPFPNGRDVHAVFSVSEVSEASQRLKAVVHHAVADPHAYAILYDAERAYFAAYLERLDDDGSEPGHSGPDGLMGTEVEFSRTTGFLAVLARSRTSHVEDGTVPDLAAFDRAVLRHTRGTYLAADHRVTSRPPMATVAQRHPDAGPGKGERAVARLLDTRVRLFETFDAWAKARDVPEGTARRLRTELETRYTRALAY